MSAVPEPLAARARNAVRRAILRGELARGECAHRHRMTAVVPGQHSVHYELLEVEPEPMRVVCAWCKRVIREGSEPVSHGICSSCAETLLGRPGS